jgi:hypothetical protein
MTRSEKIIRHLLLRLTQDGKNGRLTGVSSGKSFAVKKCSELKAILRLSTPPKQTIPTSLRYVLAEIRATASDRKVIARERAIAIGRLCCIAGVDIGSRFWNLSPVDEILIANGISIPPEAELARSRSVTFFRDSARRQALRDVTAMFEQDRADGRFSSLAEVVLRLPESETAASKEAPATQEQRAAMAKTLAIMGRE